MTEIFDIYDDNLNLIGTKEREAVHLDGDWHRTFHCWVIYRDVEGVDWVIFQKRHANKKIFPNYLDISAAGHYATGENADNGGLRELEEELGLHVAYEDLISIGRRVSAGHYGAYIDREVEDVFFYIFNQPLADYVYQREELAGLVAVKVDEGIRLLTGDVDDIQQPAVGFDTPMISITRDDFIPTIDDYSLKILLLARQCLDGQRLLRV